MSAHEDEFPRSSEPRNFEGSDGGPLPDQAWPHCLAIELEAEPMRMLQALAQDGLLGSTADEVAAYLIRRGLDDLARAGAILRIVDVSGDRAR